MKQNKVRGIQRNVGGPANGIQLEKEQYSSPEDCRRIIPQQQKENEEELIDLVVIGGGPAGLSAATFAATLRIKTLLIAGHLGGQAGGDSMGDFTRGFELISRAELVAEFNHQLFNSDFIDHLTADVQAIHPVEKGFLVRTFSGTVFNAKAVLVATGLARRRLGVPGEDQFQRRGIYFGKPVDCFGFQDNDLVVIGEGNAAMQIVESLQDMVGQIYLVCRSELFVDPTIVDRAGRVPNLTCYQEYETVEFTGEEWLEGVLIRNRETNETLLLPAIGALVAIDRQPNTALVAKLLPLNKKKEIPVGPDCSTDFPGLFAAGDVTDTCGRRITIAAGEGAKAAISIREYLNFIDSPGHQDNAGCWLKNEYGTLS